MQIQQLRALAKDALTGIAEPDREIFEADLLLEEVSGLNRAQILAHPNSELEDKRVTEFLNLLERRKTHEPMAYLTGHKEFFGYDFEVSPDVLIPRPETELLVELLLGRAVPLCEEQEKFTVVDIGTGSGAILLSLARTLGERFGEPTLSGIRFVGVDRSQEALQIAARNASALELLPFVLFGPSDLLTIFRGKMEAFAHPILFVANLPYIPDDEVLPLTVGEFEPHIALRGGKDGLDVVRRCIEQWEELAGPSEPLFLEVGQGQAATISSASRHSVGVHQDLRGIDRVVELEKR